MKLNLGTGLTQDHPPSSSLPSREGGFRRKINCGIKESSVEHLDHVAENTAFHLGNFALGAGWQKSAEFCLKLKHSLGVYYRQGMWSLLPIVMGASFPMKVGRIRMESHELKSITF